MYFSYRLWLGEETEQWVGRRGRDIWEEKLSVRVWGCVFVSVCARAHVFMRETAKTQGETNPDGLAYPQADPQRNKQSPV